MSNKTKDPSIKIVAKHVYQGSGHTEITLRALMRDGKFIEFPIDRAMITELRSLHKLCVSKNVRISPIPKIAQKYLQEVVAGEKVKATPVALRCGLLDGTYLTPHASYGKNPSIQIRDLPQDKGEIAIGMKSGDFQTYLRIIKPLLAKSRKLKLLMGGQCASIIADLVAMGPPMIFHLGGESGLGKTALIRIAMSFVGRAKEDDPKTYASTEAGLEDYFAFYRNSLTVLDEMGLASDDPRDILKEVQHLAYLFGSGGGRTMSAIYRQRSGQSRRTWAQIAVSSGESTLKELQAQAGKKLPAGVLRRMVDIPVTASETVFDIKRQGKYPSSADVLAELTEACDQLKEHYGVALEPFVKWINTNEHLREDFKLIKDTFVKANPVESGWHHAVVNHFATCCAGGVLGIRAGVIPSDEDAYIKSMKRICYDAIQYTTQPSTIVEERIEKLMDAIEDRKLVARKNRSGEYPKFDRETSLGFVRTVGGKRLAMILATRLNEFLGSKHAALDIAHRLQEKKKLVVGSSGKLTQPVDLPDGGKQVRCYRVKI